MQMYSTLGEDHRAHTWVSEWVHSLRKNLSFVRLCLCLFMSVCVREQHQPKRKKSKRAGKNSLCVQGCFRVWVGASLWAD